MITSEYGGGGESAPLVAVVTLSAGVTAGSSAVAPALREVTERIERAVPDSRAASCTPRDSGFVSRDGRTTFVLDYPPPDPGNCGQSPQAEQAALRGVRSRAPRCT